MAIKSLAELYGYKEPRRKTRRVNSRQLRGMILAEARRPLREQEEEAKETESVEVGEPKGTAFDGKLNFKDAGGDVALEIAAQILTRDPDQPIFKAMEFTPKDKESGEPLPTVKPDPEMIASWLEDVGVGEFQRRIEIVGDKIPAQGLTKPDMPFLPGPDDAVGTVEDVVDALTPGGETNIDFREHRRRSQDSLIMERWSKLAGLPLLNEVTPPEKNTLNKDPEAAEAYLTSGLPDKDGADAGDNDANVVQPAGFSAEEATPTQSNILLPKALGMAAGKGPGKGVRGGELGAYFSTEGHILDGHHRWAATVLNGSPEDIKGFAAIDLAAMGGKPPLFKDALKHLTALGNALGNETKDK